MASSPSVIAMREEHDRAPYVERVLAEMPTGLQALYREIDAEARTAPGSSHNHQTWPGGYWGHLEEILATAQLLYASLASQRPLPFDLHDAWLVLLLHDIEKPLKYQGAKTHPEWHQMAVEDSEQLKATLVWEFQIPMTDAHWNALKYVHGEGDDYQPGQRVMNELAVFVHMCDYWSARGWYDEPQKSGPLPITFAD